MAGEPKSKRKALHRGIADAINRDASATSLLLNKVQPRALRNEPTQGTGEIIAPGAAIAPGENIAPSATNPTDRVQPALGAAIAPGALLALILNPQQHTRVPNNLLDDVLRELLPSDQLILLRLYRLTWGYHKDAITVSYDRLGEACNLSRRAAIDSVKRLEREGLIERTGIENKTKGNINRGVTIRMLVPSAIIAPGAKSAPIKESIKRIDNKETVAPPDYKNCPDCQGSGFWYPEGIEKGVSKCKHPKLAQ
jgi:DNA-binding Lrp family transcriptional regulator